METAQVYQFPARRDDAQSSGPDSSQGPARSPQVEDGFIRIATELHQALARSRMTGRERAIVDAVIRFTYGWQRKAARITGDTFAEWTGLDASDCNSIVTELVRRRILNRAGSRSPIALNKDYSQWEQPRGAARRVKRKPTQPGEKHPSRDGDVKTPESGVNHPAESGVNHPTYKDMKDNPSLTSFERGGTHAKDPAPKTQAKPTEKTKRSPKGPLDLTNLPDGVSLEAAQAFIEHRKALKKPLTQRALDLSMGEAVKASLAIPGLTPDQAIDEAILAGWQGVKAQWLVNRLSSGRHQGQGMTQADRIHAANQEACRQAVANMQAGRSAWQPTPDFEYGEGDMFDA